MFGCPDRGVGHILTTHQQTFLLRKLVGPAIVFVKRRLILPLVRWLFEYADENFQRQEYVNRIVMACLEELAIENARLRAELKK